MSIFPPVPKRNLQLLPQVPLCYLTMITGTGDSWATLLLTLPRRNSSTPDRPRLPMTMASAPFP